MENAKYTPELLLPAGSLTRLKTAFLYGADAVYAGLPSLSMRARSGFTMDEMLDGMKLAHDLGKKVYLALNMFTTNADVPRLPEFLKTIMTAKPDGVIISDPGVFDFVKTNAPELPIHISTQSNIGSYLTAGYWQKQGATRVVLGREVPFKEMKEIKQRCPGLEIEQFIHGAMCMSYSGRCLLSAFLAGRSANKGACAHTCRWQYKLKLKGKDGDIIPFELTDENKDAVQFFLEEKERRQGEYFEIIQDDKGSYIMNSKDMNLMPHLAELLEAEVDSLKIEGRNKSEYYVALAARTYRTAIDDCMNDSERFDPKPYMDELETLQNRGYTQGFHNGIPGTEAQQYDRSESISDYRTVGFVSGSNADGLEMIVRNPFTAGEGIDILSPSRFAPYTFKFEKIIMADNGEEKEKSSPGVNRPVLIPFTAFKMTKEEILQKFPPFTVLRKKLND